MTKHEALVLSAFTGMKFVNGFSEFHAFIEKELGRPVWTHEFAEDDVWNEIKEKVRPEMQKICENVKDEPIWPCDVCIYNPPSSLDGKPCTYCPAIGNSING